MTQALGRHILVELYDCDAHILNNAELIESDMREAATKAGATVISSTFHHFNPHGVSGVVVIAESHLAIHTWPEYGYAALDLFTCGDECNPWEAFKFLKEAFGSCREVTSEFRRGVLDTQGKPLLHKPMEVTEKSAKHLEFGLEAAPT